MDDAFVFYAYWNGNQIRDLFEGLVSVTAGSDFVQLAAFLVVTGLVAALLIGAVKGEGKHVISYFACAVLFWFVAIVPKASVVIEDVRERKSRRAQSHRLQRRQRSLVDGLFCIRLKPHRALAYASL